MFFWNSLAFSAAAAAAAKSLQSCLTLCDPIDGSPPGSIVPGILQARTLEWAAISFSNAWKWKVKVKSLSHVQLFATPWTAAHQAPLPMGFSRQEYWSGLPLPSPYFLYDPTNVGHLISGSSGFSKVSLHILKFLVHILLKPSLQNFEHNLTSQENTLVRANTLFQWHKRRLYTWTSPNGQYQNQTDYILCSQK